MIETNRGLPNTCCECGFDPGATWFAENVDLARSGQGRCATCAGIKSDDSLPDDFPGRDLLINAGLSGLDAVPRDDESLRGIHGIGPATARDILTALGEGD